MGLRTLSIDIGGTGTKMLVLDADGQPVTERMREKTPHPTTPKALLHTLSVMIAAHKPFDRVSVGFPGVVAHGVVRTAPNLGTELWEGQSLQTEIAELTGRPTRVINDADLQGYGVIQGTGVELVLTLGTGLGSGLYVDGRLVPNLELGHHPFRKGDTYEERVGEAQLDRIGKKKWTKRVMRMLAQLEPIFNYDRLHLGGGNVKKLTEKLPDNVIRFDNVKGMMGGIRLWEAGG